VKLSAISIAAGSIEKEEEKQEKQKNKKETTTDNHYKWARKSLPLYSRCPLN